MKTIFSFSVINLLVFFRLLTLFSCWVEEPYYQLNQDQLEWLDYNGYWVFEDIYGTIDTVYVESVVSRKLTSLNEPGDWFYDGIQLKVEDCKLINSDSNFTFYMEGGHSKNGFYTFCRKDDGFFDLTGMVFEQHRLIIFDDCCTYKEHRYTIEKGVGLIKYEYDDGDRTYTSNLIGYQYN